MSVRLHLLGRFEAVVDGVCVPSTAWARRHAAALVKALALTEGRRLHREQVLELLWPDVDPAVAAPRLHKAAHFARRALGADVLGTGNEMVWLDGAVELDLDLFLAVAQRAVREDSATLAAAAPHPTEALSCPTTSSNHGPSAPATRCGCGISTASGSPASGRRCCARSRPTNRRTWR